MRTCLGLKQPETIEIFSQTFSICWTGIHFFPLLNYSLSSRFFRILSRLDATNKTAQYQNKRKRSTILARAEKLEFSSNICSWGKQWFRNGLLSLTECHETLLKNKTMMYCKGKVKQAVDSNNQDLIPISNSSFSTS